MIHAFRELYSSEQERKGADKTHKHKKIMQLHTAENHREKKRF